MTCGYPPPEPKIKCENSKRRGYRCPLASLAASQLHNQRIWRGGGNRGRDGGEESAQSHATLSQRKVAPATIAAFALPRIQVSFFGFDAVTRGLTRLRRRRGRCKAHAIGCWYGAAYLQRVMRCPQLLSGHRRGCQVLRWWRTPHSRPQANCLRPRCISRCGKRLCIGSA